MRKDSWFRGSVMVVVLLLVSVPSAAVDRGEGSGQQGETGTGDVGGDSYGDEPANNEKYDGYDPHNRGVGKARETFQDPLPVGNTKAAPDGVTPSGNQVACTTLGTGLLRGDQAQIALGLLMLGASSVEEAQAICQGG